MKLALSDEGYACLCIVTAGRRRTWWKTAVFDLALVDVMLPGLDGFELAEYLQACEIPVIFLTARSDIADKVRGPSRRCRGTILQSPFAIAELTARVAAVLRRFHKTSEPLRLLDLTVDPEARTVCRAQRRLP